MESNTKDQRGQEADVKVESMVSTVRRHYENRRFSIKHLMETGLLVTIAFATLAFIKSEPSLLSHVTVDNNASSKKHKISVKANVHGHYVLQGLINGKPVRFLIDTGATDIAMSESEAIKLSLLKGKKGFTETASGRAIIYDSKINSAQIGHIKISNLVVSIIPKMKPGEVLLGMNFLKHLHLNQYKGVMTLTYKKD